MKGSCHCGRVTLTVPRRPDYLNQCNCSACSKLGTLWGYYATREVAVAGAPQAYRRVDVEQPKLDFNFCDRCGATTHWSPTEHLSLDLIAANMRLFDPAELVGVEVRYGDRRNHPDSEPRRYYREPTVFDGEGVAQ